VEKLSAIDTGTKESEFFWGRWESSTLYSAALLAPYVGDRIWGRENVVIAFDSANVVQGWKVLKDKDLLAEISRLEAATPAADNFSTPVRLNVKLFAQGQASNPTADVVLSTASFEYRISATSRTNVTTSRANVTELTSASESMPIPDELMAHAVPDPTHVWVTIHFAKRTKMGKALTCGVDPQGLLVLRRFVTEVPSRKN
jgi:hypothetical protein